MIKKMIIILLIFTQSSMANKERFDESVVRIINEFNAVIHLIDKAQKQQPKNSRVKLHLVSYKDASGESHKGLKNDIEDIKAALITYINKPSFDPKKIQTLDLDYIGR